MDIQEAIKILENPKDYKAWEGDYWLGTIFIRPKPLYKEAVNLAIVALKEMQEREKPILDVSQVKTGCIVHDKEVSNDK